MPLYEYECRACQLRFERRQSFHDEPIKVCPTCSGETRRLFQPAPVIFKGSGWYVTDSRKGEGSTSTSGNAPAAAAPKSDAAGGESGGATSAGSSTAEKSTPSSSSGSSTGSTPTSGSSPA